MILGLFAVGTIINFYTVIEMMIFNPLGFFENVIQNIGIMFVYGAMNDLGFIFIVTSPPSIPLVGLIGYVITVLIAYAVIPITIILSKGITTYRRIIYAILIHFGFLWTTFDSWGILFG